MKQDPDAQLMLRFKDGDTRAFQELFKKYSKKVVNYCYRFTGNQELAEELGQEVFLRVYKAGSSYKAKSKFSTWLFRIATNICLNEVRKLEYKTRKEYLDAGKKMENGEAPNEIVDDTYDPQILYEKKEQDRIIQQALMDLPEKQRAALLLRVNHGFSYKDISQQTNKTEAGVKTLIHRGRLQLKKMLQTYF